MDPSISLVTSTKCYRSLVCKIHEIFVQMETNLMNKFKINKKAIQENETNNIYPVTNILYY